IMYNGDDAPVFPSGAGADPWSVVLPGAYAVGTAGYLVGTNLDAKTSSRLATGAYTSPPAVSQIVAGVWDELKSNHNTAGTFGCFLDAAISTRSTFAGGAVASVTSPVTVAINNDKSGYTLAGAQSFSTTGTVGGVTATVALSAVDSNILHFGTALAGATSNSVVLAATASNVTDLYVGSLIKLYSGTGSGQARTIVGYNGTTHVATMDRAWVATPDTTSQYAIIASSNPGIDSGLRVSV